jgi:hypothetical protein
MIGGLLRVGIRSAATSIAAGAGSLWTTLGGAQAGAGALETGLGVLRVASAVDTAINLPDTLKSIGIGASNRFDDAKQSYNEYQSETETMRKLKKLKEIYTRDTGKQPPVL